MTLAHHIRQLIGTVWRVFTPKQLRGDDTTEDVSAANKLNETVNRLERRSKEGRE